MDDTRARRYSEITVKQVFSPHTLHLDLPPQTLRFPKGCWKIRYGTYIFSYMTTQMTRLRERHYGGVSGPFPALIFRRPQPPHSQPPPFYPLIHNPRVQPSGHTPGTYVTLNINKYSPNFTTMKAKETSLLTWTFSDPISRDYIV